VPAWRAKLASLGKRSAPAVRPISSAAVSAAAGLGEQLRAVRLDQCEQLALEHVHLAAQQAQLGDLLARDSHAGTGGQPAQAAVDPVELARLLERAAPQRALELGREIEQVPAQPVLDPRALGDQVLAVVGQQPDLHRPLIEMSDGEALHAVLDHGPGDRQRVDLVRLARLALPTPGGAHPVRCDTHDPLAGRDQRLLEPARDVATVLDRPDPLLIEPARPAQRGQVARLLGLDLALAALAARSSVDGRQRMRALVRVRSDHDHLHRPFVWFEHRRSGSPADNRH
jgi:hypothetical protein